MSGQHRFVTLMVAVLLATATQTFAQGRQAGTVRGTTYDSTRLALPGVTITVKSIALQGERVSVSGATGAFEFLGLPPGLYDINFELDGFNTVAESARVPLGGVVGVNVEMEPGQLAESIQVTAVVPSALASTEASHNLRAEDIDRLPTGRNLFRIAELAPGLTANTPTSGQVTINGAFAYDNVFLIDGVDTNDNIFGDSDDLFIEDAFEEVQVLTSGLSAEYGRFSGGVINAITKSGGNVFSGSFRSNLYKPDWTTQTPFEVDNGINRTGTLANNSTYETTIGGPIVQDRLWFYYANRIQREGNVATFDETGVGYDDEAKNDRNLIKLTGRVAGSHTLEGSYLQNSTDETGPTFPFTIDPAGLRNRQVPNDLIVAKYRGAATRSLFTEFQVSRKQFGFRNSGGTDTNIVESPFLTLTQSFGHYNAPYFDANDPQNRDNLQFTGSATYFADTGSLGTHSIKSGFEHFTSTLQGGNSQSATGYVFYTDYAVDGTGAPLTDAGGRLMPTFIPGATQQENWRPVRGATLDIRTLSFYVNDSWQAGSHLSFNLGVRAEKNDSEATGNLVGIDTSSIVPRLSMAYDPTGDGKVTFHATYGHYAGKFGEAQFNQNTNVGSPDLLIGIYTGPEGVGRDFAPGFDPDNYQTVVGFFPVQNVFFEDSLKTPPTKELTFGGGAAIGRRGYTRVTYIHRTVSNFVEDFLTLDGGATTIVEEGQNFGTFTNKIFQNTDLLSRNYDAVEFLGRYQATDRFVLDASVTVQINNEGNFAGEAANQPAISSRAFDYPEITPANRYYPTGRLNGFQKHKTRVWAIYNLGLGDAGAVDIAALWRYDSGRVFDLAATGVPTNATQQQVLNSLGYANGPSSGTVYFDAGRGSGQHTGYGLLDLSFTYSIPVWQSLGPWFKAEIYNVLNNATQIGANTSISVDPNSPLDEFGIPTGYLEGSRFGEATSVNHYPQYLPGLDGLRTFRMSLGFRF